MGELRENIQLNKKDKINEIGELPFEKFHKKGLPIVKTPRELMESGAIIDVIDEDDLDVSFKDKIYKMIGDNDSSVIVAETGAGKTIITPFILMEMIKNGDLDSDTRIAITQPRAFPVYAISDYVSKETNQRVGDFIGVNTKGVKEFTPNTKITFMTDGVLTMKSQADRMFLDYDVVVVDEVHERSLNIDILMAQLKEAQKLRKEAIILGESGITPLKIIVMSATIEKERITSYLSSNTDAISEYIEVPGRTFSVDESFVDFEELYGNTDSKRDIPEYSQGKDNKYIAERRSSIIYNQVEIALRNRLRDILFSKEDDGGDILIFMPDYKTINLSADSVESFLDNNKMSDDFVVLKLTGSMKKDEQNLVFQNVRPKRKIIIATNVAETSITIDGVTCVVDSGLSNQSEYDAEQDITRLGIRFVSQANIKQRKGRAGRTKEGHYYSLYSKEDFDNFDKYQKPEILRSDMARTILFMKNNYSNVDVRKIDFIDKPENETIDNGEEYLKSIGAIDEEGNITEKGRILLKIHEDIKIADILYEARNSDNLEYLALVSSFLSTGNKPALFIPFYDELKASRGDLKEIDKKKSRDRFDAMYSKFKKSQALLYIDIFNKYKRELESGGNIKQFCYDNFIVEETMKNVSRNYFEILKNLKDVGFMVDESFSDFSLDELSDEDKKEKEESILKIIAGGFIKNLMDYSGSDTYDNVFYKPVYLQMPANVNFGTAKIHPMSISAGLRTGSDEFLVFFGSMTYKEGKTIDRNIVGDALNASFNNISYVKKDWIPEIAPHLVDKRLSDFRYDEASESFIASYSNTLKKNGEHLSDTTEVVTDQNELEELLADFLISYKYKKFCFYNEETIQELEKYNEITSGFVNVPDLKEFYKRKLKGCKNLEDVDAISDSLFLDGSEYCNGKSLSDIKVAYPERIEVKDYEFDIFYDAGDKNSIARIKVPIDAVDSIEESDFELIGHGIRRPKIIYSIGSLWSMKEASSIDGLREVADKDRIKNSFSNFVYANRMDLPTINNFDFNKLEKISFTTDIRGNDVFAYPCIVINEFLDYELDQYIKKYQLTYVLDKQEADEKNSRALIISQNKEPEIRRSSFEASSIMEYGSTIKSSGTTFTLGDSIKKETNQPRKKVEDKKPEEIKKQSQGPREITAEEIEKVKTEAENILVFYKDFISYINRILPKEKRINETEKYGFISSITTEISKLNEADKTDFAKLESLFGTINGFVGRIKSTINKILNDKDASQYNVVKKIKNVFNKVCSELELSEEQIKSLPISNYSDNDFLKILVSDNKQSDFKDYEKVLADYFYELLGEYIK